MEKRGMIMKRRWMKGKEKIKKEWKRRMSFKILEISPFPLSNEEYSYFLPKKERKEKNEVKRGNPDQPILWTCYVHVPSVETATLSLISSLSSPSFFFMTFINCWPNVRIHFQRFLSLSLDLPQADHNNILEPAFSPSNISCLEYSFSWHQLLEMYPATCFNIKLFFRDKPAKIVYYTPFQPIFRKSYGVKHEWGKKVRRHREEQHCCSFVTSWHSSRLWCFWSCELLNIKKKHWIIKFSCWSFSLSPGKEQFWELAIGLTWKRIG